jgi:hypothetical protein
MEAASTSETSVNFYQTTRRNNPEDSHLLYKTVLVEIGLRLYGYSCRKGVFVQLRCVGTAVQKRSC